MLAYEKSCDKLCMLRDKYSEYMCCREKSGIILGEIYNLRKLLKRQCSFIVKPIKEIFPDAQIRKEIIVEHNPYKWWRHEKAYVRLYIKLGLPVKKCVIFKSWIDSYDCISMHRTNESPSEQKKREIQKARRWALDLKEKLEK